MSLCLSRFDSLYFFGSSAGGVGDICSKHQCAFHQHSWECWLLEVAVEVPKKGSPLLSCYELVYLCSSPGIDATKSS